MVIINLGLSQAYLVSDHRLLYDILVRKSKSFEKGQQYDRARPMLGNGVLISEGDFHRRQRRIMQPAFNQESITSYLEVMNSSASDVFHPWKDGQRVLMYETFYELAVRIVIKTLFTTEMAELDIAEVYRLMPLVISGIERRAAIPPILLNTIPSKSNKAFHAAVRRLRGIGERIVVDHRNRAVTPAGDLMTLLISSKADGNEAMTDRQIHDEFMTLLTAGSETTPSAMAWTCYLLGQHPDVQSRIQQEVDSVIDGSPITATVISQLPYTRRVVQESLRLYPPVWALGRRTSETVELGGHTLPPKTQVFYSIYAIHRDQSVYSNPDVFDPDRWEGLSGKNIPRSAFTPFGAGARNCIGESFAWTEIQAVLATLMKSWTIKPVHDAPISPIAMGALVPGPLPMTVHRR